MKLKCVGANDWSSSSLHCTALAEAEADTPLQQDVCSIAMFARVSHMSKMHFPGLSGPQLYILLCFQQRMIA